MLDSRASLAPSMPGWFLYPVLALLGIQILYVVLRTRTRAGQYLILICWIRFAMDALHSITFREVAAGLSWMALGSICSIGAGVLVLDRRRFFNFAFLPVVALCLLLLISAVVNHDPASALEPILRFVLFAVVCVAVWEALDKGGTNELKRLLWVFALALIFQAGSVVLGVVKASEFDNSASYIGGFNHEQHFSLILVSCFVTLVFASPVRRFVKLFVGTATMIGLYLANYRTAILGVLPLLGAGLIFAVPRSFVPTQRSAVRGAVAIVGAAVLILGLSLEADRFADLQTVSTQRSALIKPPEQFTADDRKVLSGRPYIWSLYLYAYKAGSRTNHIIGFGPDSWVSVFPWYAHNTLISSLFELGVLGVAAILLMWATMFLIGLRARPEPRRLIIAGHFSFLLLNMATMPHWQIEGNILYGILCGYTLYEARLAMFAKMQPRTGPPGKSWPLPRAARVGT